MEKLISFVEEYIASAHDSFKIDMSNFHDENNGNIFNDLCGEIYEASVSYNFVIRSGHQQKLVLWDNFLDC